MKEWKKLNAQEKFSCKPFTVLEEEYEKPNNLERINAYILKCPSWVNIIGLNEKKEILVIQQFRFGTKRVELEIPGGAIDDDEAPLDAARREFEEETGFISYDWKQIGVVDANPAIMTNKCYTFLAANIKPQGTVNLDPDEIIDFKFIKLKQARQYIREGKITNAYIVAAFHWFALETELK